MFLFLSLLIFLAGVIGIEPIFSESKSDVLPLNDTPILAVYITALCAYIKLSFD